jgi:hypothetical protein
MTTRTNAERQRDYRERKKQKTEHTERLFSYIELQAETIRHTMSALQRKHGGVTVTLHKAASGDHSAIYVNNRFRFTVNPVIVQYLLIRGDIEPAHAQLNTQHYRLTDE